MAGERGPHSGAAMRHSLHGFVMREAASAGQLKPDCRYLGPGIVALTIWQPWATLIIEGWKPSVSPLGLSHPAPQAGRPAHCDPRRRIRRDEVAGLLCRLERKHSRVSDAAVPFLESCGARLSLPSQPKRPIMASTPSAIRGMSA